MSRLAVALAVCAGCSPGAFDDRRDQAWSDSNGAPDAADVGDFGFAVTAVATGRQGLHVVAAGAEPLTLSTLSYDGSFDFASEGSQVDDVNTSQGAQPTVVAAPFEVAGSDGLVAVGGLGNLDQILLFDARTGNEGPALAGVIDASACGTGLENLGHAMTFARTDLGDPSAPELIALAGTELLIFPDVDPSATSHTCYRCDLQGGARGLALGAADFGFGDGDGIVMTVAGGFGGIVLFRGSTMEIHDGGTCFTTQTPQAQGFRDAGTEADVGAVMAIGAGDEFNAHDIAMAAPSSGKVYVTPGASTSGPSGPTLTLGAAAASGEFGASLAFGDLDGDDIDELIVGDPGASPEGVADAGSAFVFTASDGNYEVLAQLYDSTAEEGQRFGRSLAIGELVLGADDRDQLIVGAVGEVFTYFRALVSGTDPRFE